MFGLMTKVKKTEECTHIQCNDCRKDSTIEDWDKVMSWMGKDFPSIREHKTLKIRFTGKFQCPKCFMKHTLTEMEFK